MKQNKDVHYVKYYLTSHWKYVSPNTAYITKQEKEMRHKNKKRGSKIIMIWSDLTFYYVKSTELITKLLLKLKTSHSMTSNKIITSIYSHHIVYNHQFYCKNEESPPFAIIAK